MSQKFQLERVNRDVPEGELIADLQRVAAICGGKVTVSQYDEHGRFGCNTLINRFGKWSAALTKAKLSTNLNRDFTKADLLEDIKSVALISEGILTSRIYEQKGKFGLTTILRHFGRWSNALKEAGLSDSIKNAQLKKREVALLENIESVWLHLGHQPRLKDLDRPPSQYGEQAYRAFYGSWMAALERFVSVANGTASEDEEPVEPQPTTAVNVPTQTPEVHKSVATPKKTNRTLNLRLRWQVFKRDNFRCVNCGRSPAKDPTIELHADHITAWSKGGETVLENLQTLCSICNLGKSDIE